MVFFIGFNVWCDNFKFIYFGGEGIGDGINVWLVIFIDFLGVEGGVCCFY